MKETEMVALSQWLNHPGTLKTLATDVISKIIVFNLTWITCILNEQVLYANHIGTYLNLWTGNMLIKHEYL